MIQLCLYGKVASCLAGMKTASIRQAGPHRMVAHNQLERRLAFIQHVSDLAGLLLRVLRGDSSYDSGVKEILH